MIVEIDKQLCDSAQLFRKSISNTTAFRFSARGTHFKHAGSRAEK